MRLPLDINMSPKIAMHLRAGTGVVPLRLRSVRTAHVQQRVSVALAEATDALRNGAVVLVEDARIRVRTWPIAQRD
jgi:pyruvate kinase